MRGKKVRATLFTRRVTRAHKRALEALKRVEGNDSILCNVLQFVPNRTLLLSTRVSRRWKRVISESATLQQQLFLAPCRRDNDLVVTRDERWPGTGYKAQQVRAADVGGYAASEPQVRKATIVVNPLLAEAQHHEFAHDYQTWAGAGHLEYGELLGRIAKGEKLALKMLGFEKGSWEKMYVTQPPCEWYCVEALGKEATLVGMTSLQRSIGGVTMGDVLDCMVPILMTEDAEKDGYLAGAVRVFDGVTLNANSTMAIDQAASWSRRRLGAVEAKNERSRQRALRCVYRWQQEFAEMPRLERTPDCDVSEWFELSDV